MVRRYPIRSENIVAHIRKATQGRVALENTHPFVRELWGRYWVFAHNGDLKGFAPRLHGAFRPVGATDSERAFCWLMQELAKSHAGVPPIDELTATLAELMPQVAAHGVFNAMLSNGQALWAHCSTSCTTSCASTRSRAPRCKTTTSPSTSPADLAARSRRGRRHRAADEGRSVARVRGRRAPRLRPRRTARRLTCRATAPEDGRRFRPDPSSDHSW